MEIAKYDWQKNTRTCDFCLSLHEGSVFADFAIDPDQLVHLLRISFDGYGCCTTEGEVTKMSASDSAAITRSIACDSENSDLVRNILYRYFFENRDVIWKDALVEHQLLLA